MGNGAGQTMDINLRSWVPEIAFEVEDDTANLTSASVNDDTNTKATAYGDAILTIGAAGSTAQEAGGVALGTDAYISISTQDAAEQVITQMETAITAAAAERASLGAYINRLEYAADNLMNVAQNTDASRSRIEDADYAAETSELARTQIISQASTAMLAQANQTKQSVLALLQG
jgi:flagellin